MLRLLRSAAGEHIKRMGTLPVLKCSRHGRIKTIHKTAVNSATCAATGHLRGWLQLGADANHKRVRLPRHSRVLRIRRVHGRRCPLKRRQRKQQKKKNNSLARFGVEKCSWNALQRRFPKLRQELQVTRAKGPELDRFVSRTSRASTTKSTSWPRSKLLVEATSMIVDGANSFIVRDAKKH